MRALTPPTAYSRIHRRSGGWRERGRHTHLRFNSPTIRHWQAVSASGPKAAIIFDNELQTETPSQPAQYCVYALCCSLPPSLPLSLSLSIYMLSFLSLSPPFGFIFCLQKWQNVIFGIFCYCQNGLSTSATQLSLCRSPSLSLSLSDTHSLNCPCGIQLPSEFLISCSALLWLILLPCVFIGKESREECNKS